jgi:sugar phosphate isomerase/epimerase
MHATMNPNSSPAPDCTRRDFLARLAVASAAAPLIGSLGAADVATKKPAAASAMASAAGAAPVIHVFAKPLQWLSYDETAAMAAETGFGGIDYAVRPGGHVLPEKVAEDLPRAVEAAQKKGLKVEMITTGITSARDKFTEPVLRAAAKAGVKYYRLGFWSYNEKAGVWPSLQEHRVTVKELAQLNESLGLHGAFQNHAGTRVGGPLWDLHELVRDVDPRWIGVQYDIRHATAEGGQSWPLALKLLAPWIKTTDIKDFKWLQSPGKATIENVPLGEGIVNFDQYFKLVTELKIRGPISVHFEYPPFERAQISDGEKRVQLPALMRKDVTTLKGWLAKHKIA